MRGRSTAIGFGFRCRCRLHRQRPLCPVRPPPRLKKIGYKNAGQDADLGGRMDTLPIVETLKKKFTLHGAELKYLEDDFRFAWCGNVKEKLPEVHGVYCLFSQGGNRLQKVGKAGRGQRLRGRL